MADYSLIDRSPAIRYIFYPRRDSSECPENASDLLVPVDDGVSVQCRFYGGDTSRPWILFFHGNGEVVSDYDEIGPLYNEKGLNIVVADYRGYGASGGFPTLTALVRDAHVLFRAVVDELAKRGSTRHVWVMGRSLGSISALELASRHQEAIRGLIIESGFTSVVRIIEHLGLPVGNVSLGEIDQECVSKVKRIRLPTLIIHGELDSLVPKKEAEELHRNVGAENKELLVIPSADHNNVLLVGFDAYFRALQTFTEGTGRN